MESVRHRSSSDASTTHGKPEDVTFTGDEQADDRAALARAARADDEPFVNGRPPSEVPARLLDDQLHRSELRSRYYGLLQELRIVLPGIQVLVAFLLTAPFSSRFEDLDQIGTVTYVVAMIASVAATICCVAPAVHHNTSGVRTERAARLIWAVRLTRIGLALFAFALLTAVFSVTRFVQGASVGISVTAVLAIAFVAVWVVLPRLTGRITAELEESVRYELPHADAEETQR